MDSFFEKEISLKYVLVGVVGILALTSVTAQVPVDATAIVECAGNAMLEGDGDCNLMDLSQVLTYGNNAGGNDITNLATPDASSDAATKGYVDSASGGGLDYSNCGSKMVSKIGLEDQFNISAPSGYSVIDSDCTYTKGCEVGSNSIEPFQTNVDIDVVMDSNGYDLSWTSYGQPGRDQAGIIPDHVGGVGDIDGDGSAEIAYENDYDLKYYDPVDGSTTVMSTGSDYVEKVGAVGDIDGDGDVDVAYQIRTYDRIEYADNSGNYVYTDVQGVDVGGVGDIDGDGDLDIAYRDQSDNLDFVDGSGNNVYTGVTNIDAVGGVGDIDGDGDMDISYADSNDNIKYVDASGNTGDWGVDGKHVGAVMDFDDDGDLDVAIRSYTDNSNDLVIADTSGNTINAADDIADVGFSADIGDDTVLNTNGTAYIRYCKRN